MNTIEAQIEAIRNSFHESICVYTRGGCYKFYEILHSIYPQSIAWYSLESDHIVTCIDGILYDITGFVIVGDDYKPLKEYDDDTIELIKKAKWNGDINYIECPNCHDFIKINNK